MVAGTAKMTPIIKQLSMQCWVATWEDTLVQLWGAQTEAPMVREVRVLAEQYFARRPGPRLGLVFIEPDAEPPDARARSELKALGKLFESNLTAMTYVYAGSGFRAAAIRSVMATILFVNSLPMRLAVKTFARPEEACTWLANQLPAEAQAPTSVDRARAVVDLIDQFRGRPRPSSMGVG